MFPFYGLHNYQFYNSVSSEIFITKSKTPENKKTIPSSNTNCSVCVKKCSKKRTKVYMLQDVHPQKVQDLNNLDFCLIQCQKTQSGNALIANQKRFLL